MISISMIESLIGVGERLHDEDVVLAHAFVDADEGVVVGELEDLGPPERDADVGADLLGQLRVGIAGKDTQLIVVARHVPLPWPAPASTPCRRAARRRARAILPRIASRYAQSTTLRRRRQPARSRRQGGESGRGRGLLRFSLGWPDAPAEHTVAKRRPRRQTSARDRVPASTPSQYSGARR